MVDMQSVFNKIYATPQKKYFLDSGISLPYLCSYFSSENLRDGEQLAFLHMPFRNCSSFNSIFQDA